MITITVTDNVVVQTSEYSLINQPIVLLRCHKRVMHCNSDGLSPTPIGVRDGGGRGAAAPPNSGSLST